MSVKQKGKILIVDDDSAIVTMLEEICKFAKRDYISTEKSEDALTILEQDASISLVITDMNLPNISGRQIFTLIRRKQKDLPVVLSSGLLKEDFNDLLEEPNTAYLQKPYYMRDVLNVMSAH